MAVSVAGVRVVRGDNVAKLHGCTFPPQSTGANGRWHVVALNGSSLPSKLTLPVLLNYQGFVTLAWQLPRGASSGDASFATTNCTVGHLGWSTASPHGCCNRVDGSLVALPPSFPCLAGGSLRNFAASGYPVMIAAITSGSTCTAVFASWQLQSG